MRFQTYGFSLAIASWAVITPVFAAAAVDPASPSDSARLALALSADNSSRGRVELVIGGKDGRYDRVLDSVIEPSLRLTADPLDKQSAYKIIASRLYIKTDGAGSDDRALSVRANGPFADAQNTHGPYQLSLLENGPVAQSAIALCNASAQHARTELDRDLTLAAVWQVTTGRFAFNWKNYDRVAPSDDIQSNVDFYADQKTETAEAQITATVRCQALATPELAAKPQAAPIKQSVALVQKAAHETGALRCDGGMVRQVSTAPEGALCLCPGNTTRIAKSDNAFACERRLRR